jgi:hypothetical protein
MATAQNQTQAAFLNNLLATNIAGATAGQLQGYGNQAIGALGTGYGNARTDVTNQFQPSLSALGTGFDQARGDITGAYPGAWMQREPGSQNISHGSTAARPPIRCMAMRSA